MVINYVMFTLFFKGFYNDDEMNARTPEIQIIW